MMGLKSGVIENILLINVEIIGKNWIWRFSNKMVNKLMVFYFII